MAGRQALTLEAVVRSHPPKLNALKAQIVARLIRTQEDGVQLLVGARNIVRQLRRTTSGEVGCLALMVRMARTHPW